MRIYARSFRGEFGWELMRWQGHLRWLAQEHDMIIDCAKGHEYLYSGIGDDLYGEQMWASGWKKNKWDGVPSPTFPQGGITRRLFCDDYDKEIKPSKAICEAKHLKQKFIKYGKWGAHPGYDVVIHARNMGKPHPDWPDEKWQGLLTELRGYQVCFVGTSQGARCWGEDKRGVPLEELCDIMRNSRLMIAESSGPAHLASLCGLPHLVITDRKKWNLGGKKGRNWTRYMEHWNPLGTPAYVLDQDNYDPPVEKVLRAIEKNGLL